MFIGLFAESGLSLERLRALVEVGAAGSIVKAADADPVRQSQYSRQIKELEDFFRVRLVERQGKGIRLTRNGRELARISRFFLLGLSNFRHGCLAEEQTFRLGANATFIQRFLLPVISTPALQRGGAAYATEVADDEEIERRLHDLTLDFGVVHRPDLSRPLQTKLLGEWKLELWVPRSLRLNDSRALAAFKQQELALAVATKELAPLGLPATAQPARVACQSFLEAKTAMETQSVAALLPDFLAPESSSKLFRRLHIPGLDSRRFSFYLAWNPRLLRLNPQAARKRDLLLESMILLPRRLG